jgi:hypothetical protein
MPSEGHGFDLTGVGFPASYNDAIDSSIRRFPRIDFPGGTYQGTGQTNEFRPVDTHSFAATLNHSHGTHSLKGGVELRVYRENDFFASNSQTGQFVFDNTYTRQKDDTSTTQVALSFAAFLLGIPTSASGVTRAADYAEQSMTWGFFIHDDWKVNSKLTLNLGLRYEFETPLNDATTRVSPALMRVTFSRSSRGARQAPARLRRFRCSTSAGGLLFASADQQRPVRDSGSSTNFMPRLGFAYRFDDKTVIRGGYGIFYDSR